MINVFNYPIEPSALDEFHEGRDDGEQRVFETKRRRPEVTYLSDGRKTVDGQVAEGDAQSTGAMWSTTITRGVAHEWKDRAGGKSRLEKATGYLTALGHDFVRSLSKGNRKATLFLVALNTLLLLLFLYIVHVF